MGLIHIGGKVKLGMSFSVFLGRQKLHFLYLGTERQAMSRIYIF